MDGIIIINKEKSYTSNDVVQIVKKIFKDKVGHTGTLDPMATGVLPVLIGKGTLLSKYLINHDKIYIAKVKLGIKTDTGDITGNVLEEIDVLPDLLSKEKIQNVLQQFIGSIDQIPPMYSAIKVNGKKLYEYARQEKKVDIEPRKIQIYDLKLLSIDKENKEFDIEISCSKGTYIRTLCEDISKALGTIGTMKELDRKKVGEFEIEKSIKIDELKENFENKEFIASHFLSVEKFFENKEKVVLTEKEINQFINGVKLKFDMKNDVCRIYDKNGIFIGTGILENGYLKRDIIL